MDILSIELRQLILERFNYEELLTLCLDLGIDFDSLSGEDKAGKARELVAYMERRGELRKLANAIHKMRPDISMRAMPETDKSNVELAGLNIELASLRQQLVEIQKESLTAEELDRRLGDMLKTANRAVGRSEELTARVILPQQEDMDVRLVPSHSLERLEEYRSDENIAYLLIGLFGGAILGILGNWVTSENFVITRVSTVLVFVFAFLTVACIFWTRRIHQRAVAVRDQMLHKAVPSTTPNTIDGSPLKKAAA